MKNSIAEMGINIDEPLLWEKGRMGRRGFSLPRRDVDSRPLEKELTREGLDIPDLSEVDVVRHYTRLSQWNFGLDTGMYPLGSCTMKYNPKANESLAGLNGFTRAHPMLPTGLAQGALRIMYELELLLKEIVGMDAVSLQPAAGAQGELAGMLLIYRYFKNKGQRRSKILLPDTAHASHHQLAGPPAGPGGAGDALGACRQGRRRLRHRAKRRRQRRGPWGAGPQRSRSFHASL